MPADITRGLLETQQALPKLSIFGAAALTILLLSYGINAMDRQLFPLILTNVRAEYGFSLPQAGLLSTTFTIGLAVAGLPTGYLLARWPRRFVVQTGIATFSASTIATVYSAGFGEMLAWRTLTGVGEAMQLTALLAVACACFPGYRGAAIGAINCVFGLGAIAGPALGARMLLDWGSWRAPMITFGLIGFALMVLIAAVVRPSLSEMKVGFGGGAAKVAGGAHSLRNRNTTVMVALSIISGLVIYGYLGMYPTFLREALHFTPVATGEVISLYGLGVLVSVIGGLLGDRFSPRPVLALSFLAAAIANLLLFNGPASFAAQAATSFAWGVIFSGTIYVNLAAAMVKSVRSELAGRASGIFVTSLYTSATVAGYLIGYLAMKLGWTEAGNLQLVGLCLLGALVSLALRPAAMARAVP